MNFPKWMPQFSQYLSTTKYFNFVASTLWVKELYNDRKFPGSNLTGCFIRLNNPTLLLGFSWLLDQEQNKFCD